MERRSASRRPMRTSEPSVDPENGPIHPSDCIILLSAEKLIFWNKELRACSTILVQPGCGGEGGRGFKLGKIQSSHLPVHLPHILPASSKFFLPIKIYRYLVNSDEIRFLLFVQRSQTDWTIADTASFFLPIYTFAVSPWKVCSKLKTVWKLLT